MRLPTVVDEYTRQCLAIKVARQIRADDVLHSLTELFVAHGSPARGQSPRVHQPGRAGPAWPRRCPPALTWPGNPWENGYVESFNGKPRDELLNREIFYTLREAQVPIED